MRYLGNLILNHKALLFILFLNFAHHQFIAFVLKGTGKHCQLLYTLPIPISNSLGLNAFYLIHDLSLLIALQVSPTIIDSAIRATRHTGHSV